MQNYLRLYIVTALCLLCATLILGILASWSFLYPETYNNTLPFYQLRPFHVSAALFWILSGATASVLFYKNEAFDLPKRNSILERMFIYTWLGTMAAIFICYGLKKFGGREYWEFPPVLCMPLLISWLFLVVSYFIPWMRAPKKQPMYVWMWSTGIFFFLITFVEQNLWQIPWFRYSYLREVTVQWKANGATVGAWNQMIYGTSLYLMVKISGNKQIANGKTAFAFYMLSLSNLMFNWGHHVYNVPTATWIRDTSYLISMTEWIFLISMIQQFKKTMEQRNRLRHLITYRFIIAAEFWVFMNLLLALFMSIPAVNRYTHGTHITVAHAMGTTIGINTMILLASFSYILRIDSLNEKTRKIISVNYWISQYSLAVFWFALIAAGVTKGYRMTAMHLDNFGEIMKPVLPFLQISSYAGIVVAIGMITIAVIYISCAVNFKEEVKAGVKSKQAEPEMDYVK
jgi:nitric oxide reductase subunit B